jgi:hypothetical protein
MCTNVYPARAPRADEIETYEDVAGQPRNRIVREE